MNFMLGATAAGLATVPMEGFDASRVRRVLDIPRWGCVVLVVPIGYAAEDSPSNKTRFGLSFDPQKEVICVIGSKEAIAHFPFAFVNPGDLVLCPDPGYPVYATLTRFAGGEPYFLPLKRENGFLIDLDAIPADVARRAKILWINYPNNPTAALAAPGFYQRVVAFAEKYDVIVASDLAYSEMYYEGAPPSFLETPGARDFLLRDEVRGRNVQHRPHWQRRLVRQSRPLQPDAAHRSRQMRRNERPPVGRHRFAETEGPGECL